MARVYLGRLKRFHGIRVGSTIETRRVVAFPTDMMDIYTKQFPKGTSGRVTRLITRKIIEKESPSDKGYIPPSRKNQLLFVRVKLEGRRSICTLRLGSVSLVH